MQAALSSPVAVGDGDGSAAVPNQSESLQPASSDRDRGALSAKHRPEEVLCESESVGSDAVVGHEEPPGAPSADGVTLIAREYLRDLADHRLGIALHRPPQCRAARDGADERADVHAPGPSGTWSTACVVAVVAPRNAGSPTIPSLPTSPTSTDGPSPAAVSIETTHR